MCCAGLAKLLLVVFNIILFIIGVALLGVGIWTITDPYKLDILAILDNPIIANTAYIITALGAFIIVVSFLGCCGALKKNKCMLILYFIIVLLIFVIQFIACCVAIAYKDKVNEFATTQLNDTMDMYLAPWDSSETYNLAWNGIQLVLECCGTDSYVDWTYTTWYVDQTTSYEFPPSCCKVDDPNAIIDGVYPSPLNATACMAGSSTYMSTDGCYEAFQNWVRDNAVYVGGTGLGLAFFEILCMVFAMCIYCDVRKSDEIV